MNQFFSLPSARVRIVTSSIEPVTLTTASRWRLEAEGLITKLTVLSFGQSGREVLSGITLPQPTSTVAWQSPYVRLWAAWLAGDDDAGEQLYTNWSPGLGRQIEFLGTQQGSWEAIFAVGPRAVEWLASHLAPAAIADITVRLGGRTLEHLRRGSLDQRSVTQLNVRSVRRTDWSIRFQVGPVLHVQANRTTVKEESINPVQQVSPKTVTRRFSIEQPRKRRGGHGKRI